MKTTIIELLNKIARGEEVPKKIHQHYDYKWSDFDKDYQRSDGEMLLVNMNIQHHLNDIIEIIEETEEIDIDSIEELDEEEAYTNLDLTIGWNAAEQIIVKQQNKILKAVKQLDNEINNK